MKNIDLIVSLFVLKPVIWYLMICLYIFSTGMYRGSCSGVFFPFSENYMVRSRLHIATVFHRRRPVDIERNSPQTTVWSPRIRDAELMITMDGEWLHMLGISQPYPCLQPLPMYGQGNLEEMVCWMCMDWIGDIGNTKVHFSQMMRGTIVWMCLKSHSQKGGILSTSITSSIEKSKRFLIHIAIVHVSIAEEPIVWLLGPCWTLFFVIAGCSWLFLFWNLTNLRADISLFPTSKLQESDDQASADQHSAIWVNGDKFELSPEAMKSGQRVHPEIGLEMDGFSFWTCSGCNQDSWVDCTICTCMLPGWLLSICCFDWESLHVHYQPTPSSNIKLLSINGEAICHAEALQKASP